jgi:dCTP deaminase
LSFSHSLFPEFPALGGSVDARDERSTGILPSQHIRCLIEQRQLVAALEFESDQIQPASIDLRLGPLAYRVRASFLPNQTSVRQRLEDLDSHEMDLTRPAVLERGGVYIVPLLESVNLPDQFWAKANPKSTTGRLDILTRLITDFGTRFDYVPQGYKGKLYLEIAPQTFSVMVSQGTRLSQLRFWRGTPLPSDSLLTRLHENEGVVYVNDDEPADALISKGLWIHVDLSGSGQSGVIGYRARGHAPVIDLARSDYYAASDFWDPIFATENRFLILDPGEFYILGSQERLQIPPTVAAEMVGYEPKLGEFRVHYAGFFDPGFGYGSPDMKGTPAVLEVRCLGVPYVLENGQQVARLIFESLMAVPDRIYGPEIGSSYHLQGLSLSKQFRSQGRAGLAQAG